MPKALTLKPQKIAMDLKMPWQKGTHFCCSKFHLFQNFTTTTTTTPQHINKRDHGYCIEPCFENKGKWDTTSETR